MAAVTAAAAAAEHQRVDVVSPGDSPLTSTTVSLASRCFNDVPDELVKPEIRADAGLTNLSTPMINLGAASVDGGLRSSSHSSSGGRRRSSNEGAGRISFSSSDLDERLLSGSFGSNNSSGSSGSGGSPSAEAEKAARFKLQQLLLSKQLLQSAKGMALAAFDQQGFLRGAAEQGEESEVVQLFEVSWVEGTCKDNMIHFGGLAVLLWELQWQLSHYIPPHGTLAHTHTHIHPFTHPPAPPTKNPTHRITASKPLPHLSSA